MSAEPSSNSQTPNWQPSRQEAAQTLLSRRIARSSLIAFTEYHNPRYETAEHHKVVAAKLEAVERGEIDRLMLMLPPRHGKSELASKHFPPLALGRRPERQFISVSATSELAADFGRDVRNIIRSPEYASLFETRLAEDSQDKSKWHTDAGGIYYAIGIGGSVLGRGADIMLIDDPFATMADAQSEVIRKKVYDWYTGTAYNRLMPGGAIVLIGHRMHEGDLQGMLLDQQAAGGDRWEVVELKAISDSGEALWPGRYPIDALERIRRNTIPRFWSSLYQQAPTPDEGDYFKSEWFRTIAPPPASEMRIYGASDYAVTADGGDYTAHVVIGIDADGRMHLLDVWRKQAASDEWIDAWCALVLKWKPIGWAEEMGQIKAGVGPFRNKVALERGAYCALQQFPTRGDKAVRAQSIRGRMAMQGLYIAQNAPWRADLISECLRFPAGVHDDQVDALGLAGQLLDKMSDGVRPSEPARQPVSRDYRVTDDRVSADDAWMTM